MEGKGGCLVMNFKEYLGLDAFDKDRNGKQWTHEEIYTSIVNSLGFEDVKACIPFTEDEIIKALHKDEHLNNLPLNKWDKASGFECIDMNCIYISSKLTMLYRKIGINSFSNSDGVCILKQCAKMMVILRDKSLYGK